MYLTGNTLHLSYELKMLIKFLGLYRWYINITDIILDIIHCPVSYLKHTMDILLTSQETHYVSATIPKD
jgi:hypothetical protein